MGMILDTMEVAKEMDLDWYRISPLQPLPNTPIYEEMISLGLIEDTGYKTSAEIRFSVGPYGKLAEMEQGLQISTPNFRKAFSEIAINSVPSRTQLADIWFYMNYNLNFYRLIEEKRPNKILQQMSALSAITNTISPNNAFALVLQELMVIIVKILYFQVLFQLKVDSSIANTNQKSKLRILNSQRTVHRQLSIGYCDGGCFR